MAASSLQVLTIFSALDKVTPVVDKVNKSTRSMQKSLNNVGNNMLAMGGAGIAAAGGALNKFVKLEDEFANLRKVFKGSDTEFKKVTDQILSFGHETRTIPEELIKTSVELSKTGIEGSKLFGVLQSFDKINLALGDNFSGGAEQAAESITRLTYLYKDLKDLDKSQATLTVGNILNELAQRMPVVKAEPVVEFMNRAGGMNDLVVPDIATSAALGSTLTGLGMNPEAAASGFQRAIRTISNNVDLYAKKMGVTGKELDKMLSEDSANVLIQYAQTLKGLSASQFAKELKSVGLNLIYSEQALNKLGGSSGLEFFNKSLEIAKGASEDLTGIQKEADIVNNTTAANLQKLSNGLTDVAYKTGEVLAPSLKSVLDDLMPIIKGIGQWIKENPKLVENVVKLAVAIFTIGAFMKILSFAIGVYEGAVVAMNVVNAIWYAWTGKMFMGISRNTAATKAFTVATKAQTVFTKGVTAAQWLWNAALSANPIGLTIIAITALIALIVVAIKKWDDWGAILLVALGPLGMIINLIMEFREHWESIKKAFKEEGFIGGIKRIGQVLLGSILRPIQQLLELLSNIPGMGALAGVGRDIIYQLRKDMDVLSEDEKKYERLITVQAAEMQQSRSEARANRERNTLDINLNDPAGAVKNFQSPFLPVKVNSTKKSTR